MATTKKTAAATKKTPVKKVTKKVAPKSTPKAEKEVEIKTGKFCEYCGSQISEKAEVCTNCGKYTSLHKEKAAPKVEIKDTKLFNILSYIPFLWIVGMLSDHKDDKDVKFHIGQGILSTILFVVILVINNLIIANIFVTKVTYWYYTYKVTSGLGYFLMWLFGLIPLAFIIIGIINAAKGETKELPVIGKYSFYK